MLGLRYCERLVRDSISLVSQLARTMKMIMDVVSSSKASTEKRVSPKVNASSSMPLMTSGSQPTRCNASMLQTTKLNTPSHARNAGLGEKPERKTYTPSFIPARDSNSGVSISSTAVLTPNWSSIKRVSSRYRSMLIGKAMRLVPRRIKRIKPCDSRSPTSRVINRCQCL